jgi:hypothetical protein
VQASGGFSGVEKATRVFALFSDAKRRLSF